MALTRNGLVSNGLTTHYQIQYDDSLSTADGKDRANGLIAVCEGDFALMSGWFGGISLTVSTPVEVDIVPGPYASAGWGPPITMKPGNGSDLTLVRYLLVSEVTEMFMMAQGRGWFAPDDSNEGSAGEGLSRFLGSQFLITNGLGSTESGFDLANQWLSSIRADFVNHIDTGDHGIDAKTGCSILFIYYLFVQLGFTINQIVAAAASELAGVYQNLTGDGGDPFPFFKRLLDAAFPGTSTITTGNLDNPFPVAMLAFWVDKSTFGRDEVQDVISSNGGRFPEAFWLVLEGFSIDTFLSLSVDVPTPTGPFANIPGVTISRSATPIDFENPSNAKVPQRIRIAFDVTFSAVSLSHFPQPTDPANVLELDAFATSSGTKLRGSDASTGFELVGGADPYFTNIDPAQNNAFYLSQDLRVFTACPSLNNVPVGGGPTFPTDSVSGAFTYVQELIQYLNSHFSNPTGVDPFAVLLPGQAGSLAGDSSVTPFSLTLNGFVPTLHANYNFAVARVRLRGTAGAPHAASNVKVFFRLWSTETADTDYQPGSTYPSTLDGAGFPGSPGIGTDHHTIPFFATGNLGSNSDYAAGGINNRTVQIDSGDSVWAYYGCFLNLYDPGNVLDGNQIQHWLNGSHHCLVAQIAADAAPIEVGSGGVPSPESSDKLAQRNLQVTLSDNPGGPASHRVPQTFDIRPSAALTQLPGSLLELPDELMIDWRRTPVGSLAHIYWPQVSAAGVIALADQIYGSHTLTMSDAHTIDCPVTRGVTYIPIPPATGANYAGLFTVDLPVSVVKGQEFDIVVRRITTRRTIDRPPVGIAVVKTSVQHRRAKATRATQSAGAEEIVRPQAAAAQTRVRNWRYVVGTFQVKIPVAAGETMLRPEEDLLAIMKWRLQDRSPSDRWFPVLARYVEQIAARVDGLGGDSQAIPPSLAGAPRPSAPAKAEHERTGRVREVLFDCFGAFEGFVLVDCCETHLFKTRERGLAKLVLRACKEQLLVSVYEGGECSGIRRLIVRG